ncbi:DUF2179 domain-containing protein [Porphyromonadaceae bacterium OttesenSCG-928-L07]|nr:DUF2179 domain-containing protein [Porphyromonadaceae bacterium OttesenSCG-928-L07]MDL2251354.1 DUF2179 domain-containing protein [Odoribacter sp. OttesenSCG-928-J03]MDL2283239.1 DUF2179 domain-containing protein [Odoribacter sp. OttesenSCG-928-G04]
MFETLFSYPLLPFFVFFARICDVTLGTLRIIFISKGKKVLAPLFGFIEVFIWITVIGQVLEHSAGDIICYLAYAGGYAAGSYVGMRVEERLALGTQLIRVFTKRKGAELIALLNKNNFGATKAIGEGIEGEVHIVETFVNRKNSRSVQELISSYDPSAFYVISDVRSVKRGIFQDNGGSIFSRGRVGK